MINVRAYIKIMRPGNAAMTAVAVALGFWLGGSTRPVYALILLIIAAAAAVGFGNCINDIFDLHGDRINHPDRPLPSGRITLRGAWMFTTLLAAISLAAAVAVSLAHGLGACIPLILLTAYARRFKAVPLAGNFLVSALVAYALLFGGLGAPRFYHLLVPAALAFLLNFSREVIKDIQDLEGDRQTGVCTSATLSFPALRTALLVPACLYALIVWLPYVFGHFGVLYLVFALAIIPVHVLWLYTFMRIRLRAPLGRLSAILKWEMLAGLAALGLDRLLW